MANELVIASAVVILLVGAYLLSKRKTIEKYTDTSNLWMLTQVNGTPCGCLVDYYVKAPTSVGHYGYRYQGASTVTSGDFDFYTSPLNSDTYIGFKGLMTGYVGSVKVTIDAQGRYFFTIEGRDYRFERVSDRPSTCPKPGLG